MADPPVAPVVPAQKRPRLDHALWPIVAERARHESLRDLAVEYGVSHTTIQAIVRRAWEADRSTLAMAAD